MIEANGWKGNLNQGLAPRELEATLHAAADKTVKQIAQLMGVAPKTIEKRLEAARFKLGARSIRGLVIEAMKRQIIAPLAIVLSTLAGYHAAVDIGDDHLRRGPGRRVVEMRVLKARDEAAQTV